jgi:hypothetical protein
MLTNHMLRKWFHEFNREIFGGTVGYRPCVVGYTGPDYEGWCWGHGVLISDRLSVNLARAALAHEMIHLWQDQHGLPMDHGESFENWRKPCFDYNGLEV